MGGNKPKRELIISNPLLLWPELLANASKTRDKTRKRQYLQSNTEGFNLKLRLKCMCSTKYLLSLTAQNVSRPPISSLFGLVFDCRAIFVEAALRSVTF